MAFKLWLVDCFQELCKVDCKKQVHVQFSSLHRSYGQQNQLLHCRKDASNKIEDRQ